MLTTKVIHCVIIGLLTVSYHQAHSLDYYDEPENVDNTETTESTPEPEMYIPSFSLLLRLAAAYTTMTRSLGESEARRVRDRWFKSPQFLSLKDKTDEERTAFWEAKLAKFEKNIALNGGVSDTVGRKADSDENVWVDDEYHEYELDQEQPEPIKASNKRRRSLDGLEGVGFRPFEDNEPIKYTHRTNIPTVRKLKASWYDHLYPITKDPEMEEIVLTPVVKDIIDEAIKEIDATIATLKAKRAVRFSEFNPSTGYYILPTRYKLINIQEPNQDQSIERQAYMTARGRRETEEVSKQLMRKSLEPSIHKRDISKSTNPYLASLVAPSASEETLFTSRERRSIIDHPYAGLLHRLDTVFANLRISETMKEDVLDKAYNDIYKRIESGTTDDLDIALFHISKLEKFLRSARVMTDSQPTRHRRESTPESSEEYNIELEDGFDAEVLSEEEFAYTLTMRDFLLKKLMCEECIDVLRNKIYESRTHVLATYDVMLDYLITRMKANGNIIKPVISVPTDVELEDFRQYQLREQAKLTTTTTVDPIEDEHVRTKRGIFDPTPRRNGPINQEPLNYLDRYYASRQIFEEVETTSDIITAAPLTPAKPADYGYLLMFVILALMFLVLILRCVIGRMADREHAERNERISVFADSIV